MSDVVKMGKTPVDRTLEASSSSCIYPLAFSVLSIVENATKRGKMVGERRQDALSHKLDSRVATRIGR